MTARVLFLGLDAAEAELIDRWADQGLLPHFDQLRNTARSLDLSNSLETLPGAIWPEIHSGISAGRIPLYFHPRQLRTGEDDVRRIEYDEIDPETFFWIQAARAGMRVAAIDIPQSTIAEGVGTQITDWGSHDQAFPTASWPRVLLSEIRSKYGDYPVADCDRHQRRPGNYQRLRTALIEATGRKRTLLGELLAGEAWDLFACVLSESHCAGHQFWHFADPRHPWHDAGAPPELRHAIRDVYRELDRTLGRLIELAGDDAKIVVLASHGMGIYHRTVAILPEFLDRVGMSATGPSALRRKLQPRYLTRWLPERVRTVLRAVSARPWVRTTRRAVGGLRRPLESTRTVAAAFENNRCGAIRLNIRGREPNGRIAQGAEVAGVVEELRRELMALRDCRSGEPVVERVVTADEAFGENHHPDVPDIMVVFRTDLGLVERVRSARAGEIAVPEPNPGSPRSGDHTPRSRLWLTTPEGATRQTLQSGNVLDIAPTVLELLGLAPPNDIDGRSLVE